MILAEASRVVRFYTYNSSNTLSIASILDSVGDFSGIRIFLQGAGGGGSSGASNGGDAASSEVLFTTSLGGTYSLIAEGGKGGMSAIHTGVQGGQGLDGGGSVYSISARFGGSGAPGFYVSGVDLGSFTVGGASFYGGGASRTLTGALEASFGSGGAGGRSELTGIPGAAYVYGGSGSAGGYIESNFIPKDFIASSITITIGNNGVGSLGTGTLGVRAGNGIVGKCSIAIYK